jgi:flagellar biosynthesis protein FliQ
MDEIKTLNQRYEIVAWGALFILLGTINLIPGAPSGTGVLGIGIILLGLNLARYLSKIPANGFTITLGVIAAVLGGALYLLHALLRIQQFELPFFPVLLVVIGVIFLVRSATGMKSATTMKNG